MSKKVLQLDYDIVEEDNKKSIKISAKHLPDDLYNALMNIDLCSNDTIVSGLAHDVDQSGNWIVAIISTK